MCPHQVLTLHPPKQAAAERGLSTSREPAQEGIPWESERESPTWSLPWAPRENNNYFS